LSCSIRLASFKNVITILGLPEREVQPVNMIGWVRKAREEGMMHNEFQPKDG
jgi:hypothetical protein